MDNEVEIKERLKWLSPLEAPFRLSGFAWGTYGGKYRRLPVVEPGVLRQAVDELANNTAGGQIRFRTNATKLAIQAKLYASNTAEHIPATAVNGFDCYLGDHASQLYYGTTRFPYDADHYEYVFYEDLTSEMRGVTLHFPLFQGVHEVQIGVNADAVIEEPFAYDSDGKVIVYGTSITQGGCASRPGMAYSNILSRRFNLEFINLGFSGNGQGDPEVATFINDINYPNVVVLDYDTNCPTPQKLKDTMPEFIRIIRGKHPKVPIIVVSRIPFGFEHAKRSSYHDRIERMTFQRELVDTLRSQDDGFIHFCDGADLLGDIWNECTVDGIHHTDLGFMQLANGLTSILQNILKGR
ncbi:SGNH-like hydrolase/esterase family protein [Paenibacillus taihuensis]|uniref:SGNH-like hydrolase/esterase family protein n=1 Tax=Paenibacillus taihuensis TaxID=1156355 RepID=A0A3D9R1T4_9BACL|nr:SGNH/GDSL hydrolase family protein [Paenibacillus taihuensis]REE68103.1 SGNH-like hydrolase/esterase family protein [Paenibacillus taihuensis]